MSCIADTATIDLDDSGGVLTANAKVSADVGNGLSAHADGLYAAGAQIGDIVATARLRVALPWLLADGSAVSRATYPNLLDAITEVQTGSTTVANAIVTGLSDTSILRAGWVVEGSNIPGGTTIATIDSPTQITLSANATSTSSVSLRFFPWGDGNGTTTFNLPDPRGRGLVGLGTNTDVDALAESDGVAVGSRTPKHTHVVTIPNAAAYAPGGNQAATGANGSAVAATGSFLVVNYKILAQ